MGLSTTLYMQLIVIIWLKPIMKLTLAGFSQIHD